MRPFGYLRKSSVRDPAKDTSPETQEREVRALAERHDQVIANDDLLADWDISGRAAYTKKRLNYQRLIEAIERGEVSVVYSYSLSRLGRSVADLASLFDLCHTKGVVLRLVVDNVDTSTASGRLLANVLSSVAQFEAEVSAERLNAMYAMKRARAIENGEDPIEAVRSSPRYGEKPGQDADYVLKVFRETGSYTQTARRLNDEGIAARNGKRWWASSVGVVVERLDPELRASKPAKVPRGRRGPSSFVLSKLLRCPQDGAMLTGSRIPDKKGKRWTRYSCRHGEATSHPRVSIAEHLILPAIEAEAALYRDPDELDGSTPTSALLEGVKDRRRRTLELRLDGYITREEANTTLALIDAEMARLEAPKPKDLRLIAGRTPGEVNAILRALFERIDLDPKTFQPVEFVWRNSDWRSEDSIQSS